MAYAFSIAVEALVPAAPEAVFALLDDPRRLGRHMEQPSAMMLGGSTRTILDGNGGRAVGSVIRVEGSVLGLRLSIFEQITKRDPPRRKVWATIEEHYADLAALTEAIAPQGTHLVGHSNGALPALFLAARRPDLVHSLVLLEPPALGLWISDPPRPTELLRLLLRDPVLAVTLVRFGMTTFAPAKAALRWGDTETAI